MTANDNNNLFRLKAFGFSTTRWDQSFRCGICHRLQRPGTWVTVPNDLLHGKHSVEQVRLALAAQPGGGGGCCIPCAATLLPAATEIDGRSLRSPSELGIYD